MPGFGTKNVEISFVIVIDKEGSFVRFEDMRDEKKKRGTIFEVKRPEVRSSGVNPNFLYDNGGYVMALPDISKQPKKAGIEKIKQDAFLQRIMKALKKDPQNEILMSLTSFLSKYESPGIQASMQQDSLWDEIKTNSAKNFSFRIESDLEIIAEKKELIRLDNDLQQSSDPEMTCLITGEPCHPVELTAATMIPDSKSNAKIVSFQTSQGYDSYGKSKCYNAPISPEAEFKFSTALLHLLRPDSKNKFSISNRTFLFWSSCTSAETQDVLEQGLLSLFGSRDVSPDYGIEKIRRLFNSIYSGQLNISDNDRFYILGLSANAARIAVSYWDEMPLKDFAKNILQHFEDMEIVDTRLDKKPYSGLYSIVVSCISEEKVSDCKSKMPELITKSIFSGTPYPTNMFLGCINRLRASKPLTITRAAILKAYLNRRKDNQQKITTMLNPENTNPGYLLSFPRI